MHHIKERTPLPIHIKVHKNYNYWFLSGIRTLPLVFSLVFLSFCKPATIDTNPPDEEAFAYDLDKPDARYDLPAYLEEISGLSYYGKGKIACVQDEKANIYIWNLEKEEISNKFEFGNDGD